MTDENPRDDAGKGASAAGIWSTTSTVGELMEERRRYELWLAALEAKRAETPKHVYSRVHADYTSRLESVIGRLSGQVEGLRSELTALTTRIASIEEQQHRARDPGNMGDAFMMPSAEGARSQWSRDLSGKRSDRGGIKGNSSRARKAVKSGGASGAAKTRNTSRSTSG